MVDTTIIDIDLASDLWDIINLNDDVDVPDSIVKKKIFSANRSDLIRFVKTIGSPIKIISADIVDDKFLMDNLIKKQ